ncbi:MAG: hypothetical protein AAFV53_05290 [Myxococcota bacterium]
MSQMLSMFQKKSLAEVARELGMESLDLARMLGQSGGLPASLSFSEADVARIGEMAGIHPWWGDDALEEADAHRPRALVRSLARKLLNHHHSGGGVTRADNLFRGLDGADQLLIQRTINQMIRDGVLLNSNTASGLHVQVDAVQADILGGIADGSGIPDNIEALWS